MMNSRNWILCVILCLLGVSCSANTQIGVWNASKRIYIDKSRNVQWDLTDFDNLRVAEDYRLPQNAIFCAAIDDLASVVMINVIPMGRNEKVSSIWNASPSFLRGMKDSMKSQAVTLPGISYGEPVLEKTHYLFKQAIRITLQSKVKDARLLTDDSISFAYRMYAFVLRNEIIEAMVMVPQFLVDEYGVEFMDEILHAFGYIDASKE